MIQTRDYVIWVCFTGIVNSCHMQLEIIVCPLDIYAKGRISVQSSIVVTLFTCFVSCNSMLTAFPAICLLAIVWNYNPLNENCVNNRDTLPCIDIDWLHSSAL